MVTKNVFLIMSSKRHKISGIATQVKQGEVYTIVGEVKNGSTTWGKLKSGAGYISLGYTQRV